jgi:uncharacterized protein YraI
MKSRIVYPVLVLILVMLACNLPVASGGQPATVTVAPVEVASETPILPTSVPPTATFTPFPTEIPTITLTPTPPNPVVTPLKDPVNCRFGPGTEWAPIGALLAGETAPIQGKTAGGEWWYILTSNGANCWVAASVTGASGNLAIVNSLAPPQALVTNVTLNVKPSTVSVPGCTFPASPVELKGTISTNGPTQVTWHWETSQGDVSADSYLNFKGFGQKDVEDTYKVGSQGEFWIRLVVTSPNTKTVQAKYKVVCP